MIKIGMIGLSDGNGHPYSFSAIFNSYHSSAMQASGWQNIYHYLSKQNQDAFGILDAKITHIWCPLREDSEKIARATYIPNISQHYEEMVEAVDAVIIARDDWESHYPIALPFLQAHKFVFIDKPLSLSPEECLLFKPYIQSGHLLSFSSLKFSPELDWIKSHLNDFGEIKLIRGITPKSWEKYGIHLLDGIAGVLHFTPTKIDISFQSSHHILIHTQEHFLIDIHCLGDFTYPMLTLDFFSQTNYHQANCLDAFNSFKRMLTYFVETIKGKTNIQYNLETLQQMEILRKGLPS